MTVDRFDNLRLELRRGCLVLAVMAQLRTERYGYVLRKAWRTKEWTLTRTRCTRCCAGSRAKACWSASGGSRTKRNKRFYRLSADGELILKPVAQ